MLDVEKYCARREQGEAIDQALQGLEELIREEVLRRLVKEKLEKVPVPVRSHRNHLYDSCTN